MKGISSLLAIISTAAVSRVLAIPVASLEERQSTGDTRNDLTDGSPCKAVTVIFARGTTESGNVGSLAGPPFFTALSGDIGAVNLAVQGVAYPADIAGFLAGGDATGSATMAQLVNQAMTQCPQTKVVMSGYR
jgi:cutinase